MRLPYLMPVAMLALLSGVRLVAQTPPAPVQANPEKNITFGDVNVRGFATISGTTSPFNVLLKGKNTNITVPDKRSKSMLKIHADEIQTRDERRAAKPDYFGYTELRNNVRFTITQETENGKRVIEGSSERGSFRRETQRIELISNVRMTITDPARLNAPATLRSGRLVIDMSKTPYQYEIEGSAESNDIRFTPKADAPKKETPTEKESPSRVKPGEVHLYRYRTALFQVGERAECKGAETILDIADSEGKAQAQLRSPEMNLIFNKEGDGIVQAKASQSVRFRVEQPTPDGKQQQRLTGQCAQAIYLHKEASLMLSGGVTATLEAPDSLLIPGEMKANGVVVHTDRPMRYELKASPQTALLRFTPKPRLTAPALKQAKAPAQPILAQQTPNAPANPDDKPSDAPNFAFGTVTITQFSKGVFQVGKEATLEGEKVVFQSDDKESATQSRLYAQRIQSDFTEAGEMTQTVAEGNVEFSVQQPARKPDAKSAPDAKKALKGVNGKAVRAVYGNAEGKNRVQLIGPYTANLNDPDGNPRTGQIRGKVSDTFQLDLSKNPYEFEVDSPNETAEIDLDINQDEAATVKPAPQKKP